MATSIRIDGAGANRLDVANEALPKQPAERGLELADAFVSEFKRSAEGIDTFH